MKNFVTKEQQAEKGWKQGLREVKMHFGDGEYKDPTIDKHCSGIIAPFLVYIGRSLLFSKYLCPYMCPTVDSM